MKRIHWLAENFNDVALEPLAANWQGYYKLRVGDYRVLYRLEVEEATTIIVVEFIRHRREVYR